MNVVKKGLSSMKKAYLSLGFHTKRKIVVFESDDWGSIRTPSKQTLDSLEHKFKTTDPFLCNDAIEQKDDLTQLFSVLSEFKDKNGVHPCITANFAMANPDFENIDYTRGIYNYEHFTCTYERCCGGADGMLSLINDGIKQHLFKPQLHAREHLNVPRWMADLKKGKADTLIAFENKTLDVQPSFSYKTKYGYMDALNVDNKPQLKALERVLFEAAQMFKDTFGYPSKTFTPSCYIWSRGVEEILSKMGIKMLQTDFFQSVCMFKGTFLMSGLPHYTGQKSKIGLFYSVRNCEYEPVYHHNMEKWVNRCLFDIDKAFCMNKPAVVDTHRVNYIGSINPDNAKIGREGLHKVLCEVTKKYPDVEFMSSDELCDLICKGE